MQVRQPVAHNFYRGDVDSQMRDFLQGFAVPEAVRQPVGGIVPHAGWVFSGAVAAKVFQTLKQTTNPDTYVLFGAVHTWGTRGNSVYSDGSWATPIGEVEVDRELAKFLLDRIDDLMDDPMAHRDEHSLEVQAPMIKNISPDARIVPIAVPPGESAADIGGRVGRVLTEAGARAVVVGSTDLTHYGARYGFAPAGSGPDAKVWMEQNDGEIIDLALGMQAEGIVAEAQANHNACGAGAMAAAVAAAKAMGAARGELLEYTTSFDVMPDRVFSMAVGYAAIVFTA